MKLKFIKESFGESKSLRFPNLYNEGSEVIMTHSESGHIYN